MPKNQNGSLDVRDDGCVAVVFPGATKAMFLDQERSYAFAMMILSKLMKATKDHGGPPQPNEVPGLLRVEASGQGRNHFVRFVREDGAFLDCRVTEEIDQLLHLAMKQDEAGTAN